MGVYSRLYAPIFNYIHMSQAEKNNSTTTPKQPRLYNRGNDQINLDDYVRNLESGFDAWLNSRKIKDKHKEAVREAYREMVGRLNSGDGSFTSRLGGGFQDSTGRIRNADKGFDAAGVAASYLGNTLRSMDVYKEPEPTPDPSKIKYGDGAIGTALTRRLLGSAGTIQDFIDRDPYNKDTRTRGNSVRSKEFRSALEGLANDWEAGSGEFSDFTDEQRTQGLKDIRSLFTIFDNDGQITDDEYLQLARVTGMSNLRQMFATGEQTAPTVTTPDGMVQRSGRTYADFIRWAGRKYKPFTGALIGPISLTIPDTEKYGDTTAASLSSAIQGSSIQDLHSLLQRTIGRNNYNINDDDFIKKIFPTVNPGFSTQYVLGQVLNNLKGRSGGLHNFGESNLGAYFIPNTRTDRNTGFVWDSNANTISEMSIHNIPYWQAKIRSEWDATDGDSEDDLDPTLTSSYQRFKEGGVLFARGGNSLMDRNAGRGPGITGDNAWLAVANTPQNAYNVNTWDGYYNNSGIDASINAALNWKPRPTDLPAPRLADDDPNASLVRQLNFMDFQDGNYSQAQLDAYLNANYGPENVDKFWEYGYRVGDDGKPMEGHGISAGQLGIYLNQLNELGAELSWDKQLNGTGYDAWNRKFDQTGLNMYFGADSNKFNLMGPSTWNRHELIQRMQNTYGKDNPLNIDGKGIYYDGKRWQLSGPDLTPQIPGIKVTPPDPSTIKINPLPQAPQENSNVEEEDPGAKTQSNGGSNLLNTAMDWAPDLLGAGRLFASLRANNRITNILRPSLNPVLKDTYERYSPVTGAFSTMQFKNRQGADVLSSSHRAFTSDSSLAAARMLEGQRQANDLQTQGFIADDQEIKRTQAEALARQEDNMARRSEVANFNRASINQTNRERAQLEATRVNKNWRSLDNFLGGIETKVRQRADENRERRLSFAETVADDNARREYEELIRPASDALTAWTNSKDGQGKAVTAWGDYDKYTRFMKEAANRYQASRLSGRAGVYGYRYDNPYAETGEIPFSWASFRKNGGPLKPKQTDFIAQIIKLNNERNS